MSATLAIDGGKAARSRPDGPRPFALGAQMLGDGALASLNRVVSSHQLERYRGSSVTELEGLIASLLSPAPVHALAVNSGTSALLLAFASLGLRSGDEVLVPTFGFVSYITALLALGAVPRFVPVDRSLGMSPERAAGLVGSKTKAILVVHPYGAPADVQALCDIATSHGLKVVEDVAQALGGSVGGKRLGTFGAVGCLSFHHYKHLALGEGGMLVTGEASLFEQACVMHDSAAVWSMPEIARRVAKVSFPPLNFKMSEIQAALGLEQVSKLDPMIQRLRAVKAELLTAIQSESVCLRPVPLAGTDTATSIVFYVKDPPTARWAGDSLRAEGVNASALICGGQPNRHWAGNWAQSLAHCGVDLVGVDDPFEIDCGVQVSIDWCWSPQDIAETCVAIEKVTLHLG